MGDCLRALHWTVFFKRICLRYSAIVALNATRNSTIWAYCKYCIRTWLHLIFSSITSLRAYHYDWLQRLKYTTLSGSLSTANNVRNAGTVRQFKARFLSCYYDNMAFVTSDVWVILTTIFFSFNEQKNRRWMEWWSLMPVRPSDNAVISISHSHIISVRCWSLALSAARWFEA